MENRYLGACGTKGQREAKASTPIGTATTPSFSTTIATTTTTDFFSFCDPGIIGPQFSAGNAGRIVRCSLSQNDRTCVIHLSGSMKNTQNYSNTIFVGPDREVDLLLYWSRHGWTNGRTFAIDIFYVAGKPKSYFGTSLAKDGTFVRQSGFGDSRNNFFDSNLYIGTTPFASDSYVPSIAQKLPRAGSGTIGRESRKGYSFSLTSLAKSTGVPIPVQKGPGNAQDFFGNPVPSCGKTDRGAIQSAV